MQRKEIKLKEFVLIISRAERGNQREDLSQCFQLTIHENLVYFGVKIYYAFLFAQQLMTWLGAVHLVGVFFVFF